MKHTVKMVRIESKKARQQCLLFLKRAGVFNMYLYEGIGTSFPLFQNYCFIAGTELIGVVHSKNSLYLHLYLSPDADTRAAEDIAGMLRRRFPHMEMVFGDEKSVRTFLSACAGSPDAVRFLFMETDFIRFTPSMRYRGRVPSVGDARLLLPLQIQYEIEEVGAPRAQLDDRKVLRVLRKRIERGEISAIFHGPNPVALAGVNAHFESSCQIGSVFVVPDFRGRGYGRSIVSYHAGRLFKRYGRIVLFVHEDNAAALRIYDDLGFECTGVLLQANL
jgi:GNAT superfamily N-acetyltransferase